MKMKHYLSITAGCLLTVAQLSVFAAVTMPGASCQSETEDSASIVHLSGETYNHYVSGYEGVNCPMPRQTTSAQYVTATLQANNGYAGTTDTLCIVYSRYTNGRMASYSSKHISGASANSEQTINFSSVYAPTNGATYLYCNLQRKVRIRQYRY
jgi:hypothetical protein